MIRLRSKIINLFTLDFRRHSQSRIQLSLKGCMSYLHIAEKNSIAKQVANVLSNNSKRTGNTLSKFNPVFEFNLDGQLHRFSSVRGHIFEHELPPQCKSWKYFDNKTILTKAIQIIKKLGKDMESLQENLKKLARQSKHLILWLDCDRQGEAIAFQVIEIITSVNPNIKIKRARFAAVTRTDVLNAYNNLVQPNERESNAVKYRSEIDFRLGCAFTRYQTVTFQEKFSMKDAKTLTYGPCQLPTLGFIVERYLQIKNFKPEMYYFLSATCVLDNDTGIDFKWMNKNTRSKDAINLIYANMYKKCGGSGDLKGKVISRSSNTKKKYRPYPLTTIELQKVGTDKLKMSGAKIMDLAEKLYQRGIISYPRTETNAFPKTMSVPSIVNKLKENSEYFGYVDQLMNQNKYQPPKIGSSNDEAHAPIHPVKSVDKSTLTHEEWKVYDFVSRHFLACCSKDAVGEEYQIVADIGGEKFKATYLTIKERNFLEVYPYIKWANTTLAGEVPEVFDALVDVGQEKTKPPPYLSESNLIDAMEKNNIGTDSTIHEHIETVQKRFYAVKTNNTFKPTNLGASLIISYRNMGLSIAECDVRRKMEQEMNQIVNGQISLDQAVDSTLEMMLPIYDDLRSKKETWLKEMAEAMEEHKDLKNVEFEERSEDNSNFSRFNSSFTTSSSNSFQNGNNRSQSIFNSRGGNAGLSSISENDEDTSSNDRIVCYRCKKPGHFSSQCPGNMNPTQLNNFNSNNHSRNQSTESNQSLNGNAIKRGTSNLQNRKKAENDKFLPGITCYRCQKEGHYASSCPNNGNENASTSLGHGNKNQKQRGDHSLNKYPKNPFNSHKNEEKPAKKRKCKGCGIQGPHDKHSNCPTLKRNQ